MKTELVVMLIIQFLRVQIWQKKGERYLRRWNLEGNKQMNSGVLRCIIEISSPGESRCIFFFFPPCKLQRPPASHKEAQSTTDVA